MSWAKLSDDFADDCWTLSDAAFRLHVEGLTWNGRKLLDCIIPKADLRRFAKHPEAIAELLATGWWADRGDNYEIRHHATYQRLKKDILNQQEANRTNGAKGGRPRKNPRERVETQSVNQTANPVGSETHSVNPVANQKGQDRTGIYEGSSFKNVDTQTGEVFDLPEIPSTSQTSPTDPWGHLPMKDQSNNQSSSELSPMERFRAEAARRNAS